MHQLVKYEIQQTKCTEENKHRMGKKKLKTLFYFLVVKYKNGHVNRQIYS